MKTIWKVLLLTAAFVLISAMSVSASSSLCSADKTTASPGEILNVTVTLKSTDKVRSLGITLVYDKEIFELLSGNWNISEAALKNFDQKNNRGVAAFTAEKDCNGEVFKFTLKVKNGADAGQTKVKAEMILQDKDNEDLPCGAVETVVTVSQNNETTADITQAVTDNNNDTQSAESSDSQERVTAEESNEQNNGPETAETKSVEETEKSPENGEINNLDKDYFIGEGIPMDPPAENSVLNMKTLLIAGGAILICLIFGLCLSISKKQ